jgi:hypothetical protein
MLFVPRKLLLAAMPLQAGSFATAAGMALRRVAARGLPIHSFELGCETFKILRESARETIGSS